MYYSYCWRTLLHAEGISPALVRRARQRPMKSWVVLCVVYWVIRWNAIGRAVGFEGESVGTKLEWFQESCNNVRQRLAITSGGFWKRICPPWPNVFAKIKLYTYTSPAIGYSFCWQPCFSTSISIRRTPKKSMRLFSLSEYINELSRRAQLFGPSNDSVIFCGRYKRKQYKSCPCRNLLRSLSFVKSPIQ